MNDSGSDSSTGSDAPPRSSSSTPPASTVEEETTPEPATATGSTPTEIPYECLSDQALDTITTIALPISAGLSYSEIATELGVGESEIATRMKSLRREIREWGDVTGFSF